MENHRDANWNATSEGHGEDEHSTLDSREMAQAVSASERLSAEIDADDVAGENTAEVIRAFRDRRYGEESV